MDVKGDAREPVLDLRGITKRFPGVLANDGIDLTVEPGEVVALLGENGAGKSTLMNVVYGLYQPDAGEIRLRGQPVHFASPADAIAARVGMVHQHFMLVPTLNVAENVILGDETARNGLLDLRVAERRIAELAARYGLAVDPRARVGDLPVGAQQRVEILKALYRSVDVLILDEPTAVLTPQEADHLFEVLRALTAQGVAIIFISHKLREVFAIADRIVVLRHGRVVGERLPAATSPAEMATLMVGRPVEFRLEKPPAAPGPVVLEIRGLRVADDRGTKRVADVSMSVRAGEIVGLAGVEGNGQTELIEALVGLRHPAAGHVLLDGHELVGGSPRRIIDAGVAHIPEDRHKYSLVLEYSVADNLVLSRFAQPPFARGAWLILPAIRDLARRLVKSFDIRAASPDVRVGTLSGGNQQKTVLARELARPVRLVLAAQPTRGLDVGSTEAIHRRFLQARADGSAVLLVSTELDEIFALSDRIVVLSRGRVVADLPAASADRGTVGLLMAGGTLEGAPASSAVTP
jgi:general nucleoside transport system ATP-binding protein